MTPRSSHLAVAAVPLALGVGAVAFAEADGRGSPVNGFVTLRGASHDIEILGFEDQVGSFGVDAAAVFRPIGRYNIQLNATYENWGSFSETLDTVSGPVTLSLDGADVLAGEGHVFWGLERAYTFGGFVSAMDVDVAASVSGTDPDGDLITLADSADATLWGGGLELDLYSDTATLAGQLGYFEQEGDARYVGGALQGRTYPSPYFSLEASLAYASADFDGLSSTSVAGVGLEAEFQFDNTPFSVFADAGYAEDDDDFYSEAEFTVGLRWALGTPNLLERDRHSASMPGSEYLADLIVR